MDKIQQVLIQGKFLHAALNTGKHKEIALFLTCQMLFPHKKFDRSHLKLISGVCKRNMPTIYELIRECVNWGIMKRVGDKKHTIELISNEEIQAKFGGKITASAYIHNKVIQSGLSATIVVLRTIPAISCIDSQEEGYKKSHNRISKSDARANNQLMTIKEHQQLVKAKLKGYDKVTCDPTPSLSNKKGSQICGVSKPTFIKYKYISEAMGVWCVNRRHLVLLETVSIDEWNFMRKDLEAYGLPAYARHNPFTQNVSRDLACEFLRKKHA